MCEREWEREKVIAGNFFSLPCVRRELESASAAMSGTWRYAGHWVTFCPGRISLVLVTPTNNFLWICDQTFIVFAGVIEPPVFLHHFTQTGSAWPFPVSLFLFPAWVASCSFKVTRSLRLIHWPVRQVVSAWTASSLSSHTHRYTYTHTHTHIYIYIYIYIYIFIYICVYLHQLVCLPWCTYTRLYAHTYI